VLTTLLHKKQMLRIMHVEMLHLETKQSGGKLLPHLDIRGGVFQEEVSRSHKRNRDILLGTWNVRSLWEDNIKMDLQEVGGGREEWLEFGQDRERWRALVDTVRNFRVP
jgi:hypothetical protein